MDKPTHFYIGRLPCGCVLGVCVDRGDAQTRHTLKGFIRCGLTVKRVSEGEYKSKVVHEEGHMNCFHGQRSLI